MEASVAKQQSGSVLLFGLVDLVLAVEVDGIEFLRRKAAVPSKVWAVQVFIDEKLLSFVIIDETTDADAMFTTYLHTGRIPRSAMASELEGASERMARGYFESVEGRAATP